MLAPKTYTDNEAARHATFTAAVHSLSTWRIAQALNTVRPGIDYRGCTKGMMRDEFCRGELAHLTRQQLADAIERVAR